MNSVKTIILTGLALLALSWPLAAADELDAAAGRPVRDIDIALVDCPWDGFELEVLAYDILSLNYNQPFSRQAYEQSIAKLKVCERFTAIDGRVELVPEGVKLSLRLKPAWVLRKIEFDGIYPLFASEVLKALSLHAGDPFDPATVASQAELVRELYVREGFAEPQASTQLALDRDRGTAVLTIRVKPGPCYRLTNIRISGNRAMSDDFILSRMHSSWSRLFVSEGRRFRQADFDADLKNLQSAYWRKGYADCTVTSSLERDQAKRTVKARINVSEGPRYKIELRGNRKVGSRALKKQVTIFGQGNRRDRGLTKTLGKLRETYQDRGFREARVEMTEDTSLSGRKRKIIFSIEEGRRSTIRQVSFEGNQAFDDQELRQVMPSLKGLGRKAYISELVSMDLAAIQALYSAAGYSKARLDARLGWRGHRASLNITIAEGPRACITALHFDGLDDNAAPQALNATGLDYGQPLNPTALKQAEIALAQWIAEQGYPHAQVSTTTSLNAEGTQAALSFSVTKGQFVRMGNTYFQGNFKTRKRPLRHAIAIEQGEPFALGRLYEAQKDVRDMGIFENVKFKTLGLKEGDERVTLIVDLEETPPYYVQGGAGYTSDRGLYGASRIGDRNLLGRGVDAWLGGEASQIGHKADLHLRQRRTLGTPISTTYNYAYEKKEEFNQDFGTKISGASLLFGRSFDELKLKTGLETRYERREAYPLKDAVVIPAGYETRKVVVSSPSLSYDGRDSFVRPKQGIYTSVALDVSRGIASDYDDFLKYRSNLRYYLSPTDWLTFAIAGDYAHIDPSSSARLITSDQLLYLGGTMTVRGYGENLLRHDAADSPVGGLTTMAASLEARIELNRHWELSLFVDSGTVRESLDEAGSDSWRSSAGLGLRYITPIGPMGLLYGCKLNPADGDERGRFHFSLGYTF